MPFFTAFTEFCLGKGYKKHYMAFLVVNLSWICLFFIIALMKYPTPYSALLHSVSSLGNRIKNPDGSLIWGIGMATCGLAFIPIINYLYRNLRSVAYKTSIVSHFIAVISCIGVTFVGVFSEDQPVPHYTFASLAFFGFSAAFSANLYALIKSIRDKNGWPRLGQLVLLYIMEFTAIVGFVTAFSLYWVWYFWRIYLINLHLPLWEWILFASHMLYICFLLGIIPAKNAKNF